MTVAIDLHVVELEATPDEVAAARGLLAPGERARADGFVFERHRRRFTVARAALRRILAADVGEAPEALVFVEGAHGKPPRPGAGLEFTLSPSDELALVAVTRGGPVGVDVERLRDVPDALAIAESHFAPAERAALAAAPDTTRAFLNGWT